MEEKDCKAQTAFEQGLKLEPSSTRIRNNLETSISHSEKATWPKSSFGKSFD